MKLTVESFLAGVRQSGLVPGRKLDQALAGRSPAQLSDLTSEQLADELIAAELLTRWQADKLLQGKFKGFVLGRYRLLKLLGRGEMSSVYLAEHVRMRRRCAIKVLPANRVQDTSYLGRFLREAEAVARLDHPNIVRAYDVDQEEEAGIEIHFLAMEYVEGRNLEKLLEAERTIPVLDAVDYIRQAAEGLAHAHAQGMVHRDIKPGNLLVCNDGVVKLLDLGLARFFKSEEEESLTIKHDEKVLGTADYLAPEQAVDSHAVDERADIYSLGCTLYFALTGQPPFTDGTLVQRLLAHQTKVPVPASRLRNDVPDSLQAILDRMLRKSKEERYQTARELADDLTRWLVKFGGPEWRKSHAALVAQVNGYEGHSGGNVPDRARRRRRPELESDTDASTGTTSTELCLGTVAPQAQVTPQPSRVEPVVERILVPNASYLPTVPPLPRASEMPTVPVRRSTSEWLRESLRQRLVIAALAIVGVFLITGVGLSLYARTRPAAEPTRSPEFPLEATRSDDLGQPATP